MMGFSSVFRSKQFPYRTLEPSMTASFSRTGVFCLLPVFALAIGSAAAQLSTTATIAGNVTDSTGALVTDATVTATDEATRITTVRQSGPDGSYVIPSLTVDPYTISV